MEYLKLDITDENRIIEMSGMATEIIKDYFDPIVGSEQNDYMLSLFQTPMAIKGQLEHGYEYYFVKDGGRNVGFVAFYPRGEALYLSKFYLYKQERKKGYATNMMQFVKENAEAKNLSAIELNVNRFNEATKVYEHLGMTIIREEKNDIGNGFFMDDYVYQLRLK